MFSRASRDQGLRRVTRGTRYLAVGTVIAGGLLSTAVAKALPGRSSHQPTSTATTLPSANGSSSTGSGQGSTGAAALSPPAQAPQPALTSPPVVVSGGS